MSGLATPSEVEGRRIISVIDVSDDVTAIECEGDLMLVLVAVNVFGKAKIMPGMRINKNTKWAKTLAKKGYKINE